MIANERLNRAKQRLNAYYEAELAVLAGQEYRIGSRTLRRADLAEIKTAIKEIENQVGQLENIAKGQGARRTIRVVPRDL